MELNIDTGVEEFRVNGRGVLRFNPADPNLYHRFFAAGAELDGYDAALTKALAALDGDEQQRAAAGLALLNEYDGKIKKLLTPFVNGDLIRIPTEKEIFGENKCGENETGVEQWKSMKQRRNRIAFRGLNDGWEWYWLQNRVQNSATLFADVYCAGGADCSYARSAGGVRPVVKIRNPASAPACRVPVKGEREQ